MKNTSGASKFFFTSRSLLWIPAAVFVGIFFYLPLATIFRLGLESVWSGDGGAIAVPAALRVLGFTLYQATLSTLLTMVVGLPGAYLFAKFDFPLKRALRAFTLVPFILPTVVVAAGFEALLGARGWINAAIQFFGLADQPLQMLHTLGAILLAHVFYNTSIVLRVVGNAWERLDPRLTSAARVLGASRWQAFRWIALPLLMPSLWAAASLVFLFDFTSFGVILMLGGPAFSTLEVEIYLQALHFLNLPGAAFLSLLQMGSTLALILISSRLAERAQSYTARAGFQTARRPKSFRERLGVGIIVLVLLTVFILPLLSPVARSFLRLEADSGQRSVVQTGWTLDYYRELFYNRRGSAFFATPFEMAGNSLAVAAATVVLSLTLGIPAATRLVRPHGTDRVLEPLLLLPLGTSAVTLGLGMLLVFARPPLDWIRTPWMLPIAHSLVALPFVVRGLKPALMGIPARLHEAAAVLGASPWAVWRRVDFPIAARAIVSAGAFAFAISLGEFGATMIIVRPDFATMPVAIYRYLSQPGGLNYGQAMAMTTILILFCATAVLLMEAFRGEEGRDTP